MWVATKLREFIWKNFWIKQKSFSRWIQSIASLLKNDAVHDYISNELKKVREEKLKEEAVYDEQVKRLKKGKDELMAKVLAKQLSREEQRVYEWKLREYDIQIKNVLDHSSSIIIDDREEVAEFEALAYFLHNAEHVYEKANYVQRAKIVELFISNIFIDNKKSPTVQIRPSLQSLTYALGVTTS